MKLKKVGRPKIKDVRKVNLTLPKWLIAAIDTTVIDTKTRWEEVETKLSKKGRTKGLPPRNISRSEFVSIVLESFLLQQNPEILKTWDEALHTAAGMRVYNRAREFARKLAEDRIDEIKCVLPRQGRPLRLEKLVRRSSSKQSK